MDRPRTLLFALLAGLAPLVAQADESWLTDLTAAQTQAAQSGRLLVIHFWASWCGPCSQMEREVLTTTNVKQTLAPNFVLCKLNYDQYAELAQQFNVDLLPSDVVLAPDGNVVGRSRGNVASSIYLTRMTQILEQSKVPLVARVPGDPTTIVPVSPTGAMPAQVAPAPMSEPAPGNMPMSAPAPTNSPNPMTGAAIGLEGYCPVQLHEAKRWVAGDPRWTAQHAGQVFRFAGPQEQQRFLADPERYAPRLAGHDGVLAAETGQHVAGRREHGVFWHGQVFLFASEESLARFAQAPERYAGSVAQAQLPASRTAVR